MKYTININQYALSTYFPELDLVDGAILDFIIHFTHCQSISKKIDGGTVFYWISYNTILEQNPLLKMTKDRVYRRIKKLVKCDILQPHPENQTGGRTFFAFGERYRLYFVKEKVGINTDVPEPPTVKIPDPSGKNTEPPSAKIPDPSGKNTEHISLKNISLKKNKFKENKADFANFKNLLNTAPQNLFEEIINFFDLGNFKNAPRKYFPKNQKIEALVFEYGAEIVFSEFQKMKAYNFRREIINSASTVKNWFSKVQNLTAEAIILNFGRLYEDCNGIAPERSKNDGRAAKSIFSKIEALKPAEDDTETVQNVTAFFTKLFQMKDEFWKTQYLPAIDRNFAKIVSQMRKERPNRADELKDKFAWAKNVK